MAFTCVPYYGPLVTMADAKARGLKRYFTAQPCQRGHIAERRVSGRSCCECDLIKDRKFKEKHAERLRAARLTDERRERDRIYREENRERVRAVSARWRERHRDLARERTATWVAAFPERQRAAEVAYRERNRDKVNAHTADYRRRFPEKAKEHGRKWRAVNKPRLAAKSAARRFAKIKATPAWADHAAITAIYEECARISRETGIVHHVDHIYPLKGKTMCGLHVETNLQILAGTENLSKGNRPPPETGWP
jgi:hypothetical protein